MELMNRYWLLDTKFYTYHFGGGNMRAAEPTSEKPFFALFEASTTFGSIMYMILIYVILYTLVITLILHLCKMVLSHTPKGTAEAKGKVMRTLVIAFCSCGVVGFIALIASAFVV